jgi:predicted RND superfamily exporter protein
VQRFRPIFLTSATTFLGLVPLIAARSVQAQFLIPMAISLGFGVLFATLITLLLVPCGYLVLDDLRQAAPRWLARLRASPLSQPPGERDAIGDVAAPVAPLSRRSDDAARPHAGGRRFG